MIARSLKNSCGSEFHQTAGNYIAWSIAFSVIAKCGSVHTCSTSAWPRVL